MQIAHFINVSIIYPFQRWLLATTLFDFTLILFHQKAKMSVKLNIFIKGGGVFNLK